VLVGPLDDDGGGAERGVGVGGEGHHPDDDIELAGGPGDAAGRTPRRWLAACHRPYDQKRLGSLCDCVG
jgi:hypothetical protein